MAGSHLGYLLVVYEQGQADRGCKGPFWGNSQIKVEK